MGRPRKTQEAAELDGSMAVNPGRYAGDVPKGDGEIGEPPSYFSAAQKKIWQEICNNALPGVLTNTDRYVMESAALLVFELRDTEKQSRRLKTARRNWEKELARLKGEYSRAEDREEKSEIFDFIKDHRKDKPPAWVTFPTSRLQALRSFLASLGMSPTDRQRLRVPEGGEDDSEEFEDL